MSLIEGEAHIHRARGMVASIVTVLVLIVPFHFLNAATSSTTQKTCSCFCTSSSGAVDEKVVVTAADCQARCRAKNQQVAAFACGANQYPGRNITCFTESECGDKKGTFGGFQPPECIGGSHYCFPGESQIKTNLQVKIGGMSVVGDFGTYIVEAYKWMVGAATLVAIVFIMIGGLQWAFSALSAEQVSKAKKRMMDGVIGLILLLSSYLILFTVNPQLVKMEATKLPMIKVIGLADVNDCAAMEKEEYKIEDNREKGGTKKCGETGKVLKDPSGNPVPDGTVCNYTDCERDNEICIPGDEPKCMKCEDITVGNATAKATPELCGAFNSLYQGLESMTKYGKVLSWSKSERAVELMNYCFYTRDKDAGGQLLGEGVCARLEIDCTKVWLCTDYDDQVVYYGDKETELDEINLGVNSGLNGADVGIAKSMYDSLGEVTLGSVCTGGHGGQTELRDRCEWHRAEAILAGFQCEIAKTALVPIDFALIEAFSWGSYDCQQSMFKVFRDVIETIIDTALESATL